MTKMLFLLSTLVGNNVFEKFLVTPAFIRDTAENIRPAKSSNV